MHNYKAPEQEFLFLLKDLLDYDAHCQMPGFEEATTDIVETIIPEAARFFEQVIAPTNRSADQQGSKLHNGTVVPPPALDGISQQLAESGWISLNADPRYGGSGFPNLVGVAISEMLQSANMGFSLMPLLTHGVIHALGLYGSEQQKDTYLHNLVTGKWAGTMNLTEPQAGTDLGAIKTRAIPEGDHYLISGQKIFITWGDHELTDNIIHLVLARTPDAPEGTRGISMFIVPKFLLNEDGTPGPRNDLKTVAVEHKLGIHASPTCVLQYGDNGGATGYLVGEENQGLVYMFAMMNEARLAVGQQGVSISERAFQQALAYAKDRVQGTTPGASEPAKIVDHPDVRRMLMQMRALTEAGRAMSFYAIAAEDRSFRHPDEQIRQANTGILDVMTPLVKGWCTEMGMEVTSLGVQVHGGMGFIEETGAAQHFRDARILPIYEGTNGIQALDFIGRKCLRDGGKEVQRLISEMQQLSAGAGKGLQELQHQTAAAIRQCEEALAWVLQHPEDAGAVAYNFMMLFANTMGAVLLTRSAVIAQGYLDQSSQDPFYRRKIATARFYATQVLPRNLGYLAALKDGAANIMALATAELE
ncbi:MAG: acyl-CoA dehydrogenase [Gammaproteobacteria bacterium]|nr:acyl-CoA dehydrogenase [Gammaproteobacteria bacterium]